MKRVLIAAAVAAVLLSPLAAAGQQRGGGYGGDGRGEGRRYQAPQGYGRGGGYGRSAGGGPGYGYGESPRYPGRGYGGPAYDAPAYGPRAYDRQAYGGAPGRAYPGARGRSLEPSASMQGWRRGDYLPPPDRSGVVRDPGRYRLRPPPTGYNWVQVGRDVYLMQQSTGLVLDAIPDAGR